MYKQLTSQQRSQIFALQQRKTERKVIASIVGCVSQHSAVIRQTRAKSVGQGSYEGYGTQEANHRQPCQGPVLCLGSPRPAEGRRLVSETDLS